MGGSGKFRRIPAGNDFADGSAGGRGRGGLGLVSRATHDDQIRLRQHQRLDRTQSRPRNGSTEPSLSTREVNIEIWRKNREKKSVGVESFRNLGRCVAPQHEHDVFLLP